MREILFRGKRFDGVWQTGYYFARPILDSSFIISGEEQWEVIPSTVSEYTGLKDKNGKKIFEGDIVKCFDSFGYDSIEDVPGEQFAFGIVKYGVFNCSCCHGVYGFTFEPINKKYEYFSDIRNCRNDNIGCEVIGNIFDNPELIKNKTKKILKRLDILKQQ